MLSFSIQSDNGFSFSSLNVDSPLFLTEEDCLISLLKHCLSQQSLLIHIKGLSPSICKKIDLAFGKGFSFKFDFANKTLPEFISFALKKSAKDNDFFSTITFLISPFYKVSYESPDVVIFYLAHETNPKSKQFFVSKKFIQSPYCNYIYQPGDISFFSDASCESHSTLAGAAIQHEQLICAFRKEIELEDNNLAELKAIFETAKLALAMHLSHFLLYTDNSNAIDFISGTSKINDRNTHFFIIAKEIKELLNRFHSYHIAWIPRKKNFIADNLSKQNFNGVFFER